MGEMLIHVLLEPDNELSSIFEKLDSIVIERTNNDLIIH